MNGFPRPAAHPVACAARARSSVVEHWFYTPAVGGSIPSAPTENAAFSFYGATPIGVGPQYVQCHSCGRASEQPGSVESARRRLVSRCHFFPEGRKHLLDVEDFLFEGAYRSLLTANASEIADVLVHHQLRTLMSQSLGDLGAFLAKHDQEVLGLLNVGIDPTLPAASICVHHRNNVAGNRTLGKPLAPRSALVGDHQADAAGSTSRAAPADRLRDKPSQCNPLKAHRALDDSPQFR
jgi:hypothetical protein